MAKILSEERVIEYSVEYKVNVVRLTNELNVKAIDIAQVLGLHPMMIYRWRQEYREGKFVVLPSRKISMTKGDKPTKQAISKNKEIARLKKKLAAAEKEIDFLKKVGTVSEGTKKERFQFIADNRSEFGVRYLCERLGVSRDGFYKWRERPSSHNKANTALLKEIRRLFVYHDGNYGYPRIHQALRYEGWQVNRKRVARLMREERLVGKAAKLYRRKKLSDNRCISVSNLRHSQPPPTAPNKQWVGDVSYLKLKGQWLYLSVVLDVYSRKVIGWSLGSQRTTDLTLASLQMAITAREIKPGLIFHSDKGAEYGAHVFQSALREVGIRPSMNRPKSMVDNIHVESFFRTFKTESYHGESFHDKAELAERTRWYLDEYYNHQRIHSSLGYKTPHDYETIAA